MPNRYYTRRFLNRRGHHAGGYVLAYVEDSSRHPEEKYWVDTGFTIADCGRQIDLSFSVDTDDLANSLYKVDLLLDTLTNFRAALVEEGAIAVERQARARANKAAQRAAAKVPSPVSDQPTP